MLEALLNEYIMDTENPILNYKIGREYEKIGQTAAAVSYFLRASERTSDKVLSYECLIRIGKAFEKQQNRNFTVKCTYRSAIACCPDRPEAYYFLAKHYNAEQNYTESYLLCRLAEFNCKEESYSDLGVDYPGRYGLYYYEAIASWWYGKNPEARNLFDKLNRSYWNKLEDFQKTEVKTYTDLIQTKMGSKKNKIVDYCTFFEPTGKEMLRLRIAILNDYVDEFIVVESSKTQSGVPIPYELENVIEKYNLPKNKIRILKLDIPDAENLIVEEIDKLNCYENNSSNIESLRSRVRDRMQKNALLSVLDEYNDNDVFIISDIDEIIKPKNIEFVSNIVRHHPDCVIRIPIAHLEGRADLRVYMRDTDQPKEWTGMIVTTKNHLMKTTPNQIRSGIFNRLPIEYIMEDGKRMEDMGWHFSWMGGKAITKLKSKIFTHHADSFSYLVSSSYEGMDEFLDSIELKEGSISPSGDKNTILKSYPIENLPKEIFEMPEIEEFLFPKIESEKNPMITNTKQDTKETIIEAYREYDSRFVWGWCTLDKAGSFVDYVDEICSRVDNPVCVEIGIFAGKSALPVALELKRHNKGKLYAIDPWKNDEAVKGYEETNDHYEYWKNIDLQSMYRFFLNLLKEYDAENFVEVWPVASDDTPIIENIDFLYIDGQHTDQAHRDVLKFATRVKLDGYCIADDVAWGEVSKVPSMLQSLGFKMVHQLDSAFVFKRTSIIDFTKETVIEAYKKYDSQLCWGWCTLDKAGCFVDYINEICNSVDNPVCVEIGVFGGKSVLPVALELKRHNKGKLYAIDPWTNEESGKGYENLGSEYEYWKNVDLQYMHQFFLDLLKEYDVENYVEVLRVTSDNAPIIENIDYLYIDGQHTDQAHRDVLKFATRVKIGGYCIADDVSWGEVSKVPGMLEALGFMHVHQVDNAYIFKRTNAIDFTKDENNIFKINTGSAKRAFIVDNFYENPMAIREFAQKQEFIEGGLGRGFIGRRTVQQFLFPGIKEAFESIMQKKITFWKEHGMNGRFQLNIAGEQLVYHCDSQKYAAMIYLTPNAPPSCGTSTFKHKKSGVYHNSDPRIMEVFAGVKTTMDGTIHDKVDSFGNIFNRLVIFDAGCIHAASDYFGADMEDGRLWHMFFFDAE
jgi:predicted O-methyltransferase YrrM